MKALFLVIFALLLVAAHAEETTWYDAEGTVVLVEGPDAEPAEQPFVAEWRKREIERRERYSGEWSSEMWPVWGGYGSRRRSYSGDYGGFYSGIRVRGGHYGGYYRACPTPYRGGGASVIIRW